MSTGCCLISMKSPQMTVLVPKYPFSGQGASPYSLVLSGCHKVTLATNLTFLQLLSVFTQGLTM